MRHASLFTGFGGFDYAASQIGWENVFQVENNEYCNKILALRFKNTKRYLDIKEFSGKEYYGKIDIISGGFPCQPFSVAGEQRGKEDDRYLWPEMLRVVSEIRPASLYGALEVLYYAYQNDRKVLLHCQAGLNRSPTVQCAMYYMITGNHIAENVTKGGIFLKSNRLFDNSGIHLPNLWWLEEWLMNCRIVHQTPDRFPFGGKYDFTISKTDSVKIR